MLGFITRTLKFILRRRWLRRLICVVVLTPLVLFLLSNIILNSKWGRGKIAGRLNQKTGLEWNIESANWTPDGEVHVYNAEAKLGDGVMRAEHVNITPEIDELLGGRLSIAEIRMDKPEIDVSLQWIKEELDKKAREEARAKARPTAKPPVHRPPVQRPPVVAQQPDATGKAPEVKPSVPVKPGSAVKPVKPATPDQVTQAKKPVEKPQPVTPPAPVLYPEAWLELVDAKLKLRDGEVVLFETGAINGRIPLGGIDQRGFISCASLVVAGKQVQTDFRLPLKWNKDLMIVGEDELDLLGVHCLTQAVVQRRGKQFFMEMKLEVPKQDWKHAEMFEGVKFSASAREFAGVAAVEGDVLAPFTWRGIFKASAGEASFREYHRGGSVHFDRLNMEAFLSAGQLRVPQVAAVGEDLSVLGNGALQMDGYMYGVMRIIAVPEKSRWINEVRHGGHLFPRKRYTLMTNLYNPDHQHLDIYFDGLIWQPAMKIEGVCEWEPMISNIKKMIKFVHDEHLEDVVESPHPKISTKSQR